MNYYKSIIQYDGTRYCGFQWQKDLSTVQYDINISIAKLLDGKFTTMGASRTDTGVHAVEQLFRITSENEIECDSFLVELNKILPLQIRFLSITPCLASFMPTTASISKEYRYLFTNTLKSGCMDQMYIANNPYPLNIEAMKECTKMIVGKNSFHNFCSAGSNVKTTIRDIFSCELSQVNPHEVLPQNGLFEVHPDLQNCYQLKIIGSGFLKQMVRHLMSALWMVGNGRITVEEFAGLINGPLKTKRLWKVADARGLYLYRFQEKK